MGQDGELDATLFGAGTVQGLQLMDWWEKGLAHLPKKERNLRQL